LFWPAFLFFPLMPPIYDWTKPDAQVKPMRSLEAGSLVVMHKSIPGKNDEYHILEITGDEEHEFDFIGSMHKPETALLVADFLKSYFAKFRKQDQYYSENPEVDALMEMLRKKRGSIKFNPPVVEEDDLRYKKADLNLEIEKAILDKRMNEAHRKSK